VYDDFGFLVAFGLGDGSAGEDGDLGDAGADEHLVQDGAADQPGCASEDEMHCVFYCLD